jgi:4a-hydroxytetrahydrobiopterin dehydratase
MAKLLNDAEIQSQIGQLPGWTVIGQEIQLVRKFKDFVEAISFVNALVAPAEAAGHHPDLAISYNTVTINLSTHDAGGLTAADFDLAKIISRLP